MKLSYVVQSSSLLLFCAIVAVESMQGQPAFEPLAPSTSVSAAGSKPAAPMPPVRAFPYLRFPSGLEFTYIGMYCPDAVYRSASKSSVLSGHAPGDDIRPAGTTSSDDASEVVPESMRAYVERIVEDYEPPAHAQAAAKSSSRPASMSRDFLALAYGHPLVLHAPGHLVTDSRGRVIVSDPAGGAVHSMDRQGKASFRILSGPARRLHKPMGVAVDAEDNIYVADSDRGIVAVFDRFGSFTRFLGQHHGEPEFAAPHGIAFEASNQRLYLTDTPRNLVIVMDLEGRILAQLGKLRNGTGDFEFDHPTEICASHGRVFVLDRRGSRVRIFDPSNRLLAVVEVKENLSAGASPENGLAIDRDGNLFISSSTRPGVVVYSRDGLPLARVGPWGTRAGEFVGPSGLSIDSAGRLYVADSRNGRVQLFQVKSTR